MRFAKWVAFNDFGDYTKHFKAENWVDTEAQENQSIDSNLSSLPVVQPSEMVSEAVGPAMEDTAKGNEA